VACSGCEKTALKKPSCVCAAQMGVFPGGITAGRLGKFRRGSKDAFAVRVLRHRPNRCSDRAGERPPPCHRSPSTGHGPSSPRPAPKGRAGHPFIASRVPNIAHGHPFIASRGAGHRARAPFHRGTGPEHRARASFHRVTGTVSSRHGHRFIASRGPEPRARAPFHRVTGGADIVHGLENPKNRGGRFTRCRHDLNPCPPGRSPSR
jgi:hypothetical protein